MKLVGVWNIYDTAVSVIFPLGLFITFCCVILRFTFWKLHSFVNINHYFWKNRFCCLSFFFFPLPFFYLPFVSPFPLVTNTGPFSPSTASSSSCYFNMCLCVFPVVFLCAFREDHTRSYWASKQGGSVLGSGKQIWSHKITLKTIVHKVFLHITEFQKIDNYFPYEDFSYLWNINFFCSERILFSRCYSSKLELLFWKQWGSLNDLKGLMLNSVSHTDQVDWIAEELGVFTTC